MPDAWILASDQGLAGETAAALSELGLTPRRAVSNGDGRPLLDDGGSARLPEVVVVIAAANEPVPAKLCARLREDESLAMVPLVLAVDEHHLRAPGGWAPNHPSTHELIVRPFSAEELWARIQRARAASGALGDEEVVQVGSLTVDLATYQVAVEGRPIDFAYMEYELLKFLVTHPRRVFSREALLSAVWGYDYYGGARTVDVHVRRLRAKLGQEHGGRIKTVRGVGYKFEL